MLKHLQALASACKTPVFVFFSAIHFQVHINTRELSAETKVMGVIRSRAGSIGILCK